MPPDSVSFKTAPMGGPKSFTGAPMGVCRPQILHKSTHGCPQTPYLLRQHPWVPRSTHGCSDGDRAHRCPTAPIGDRDAVPEEQEEEEGQGSTHGCSRSAQPPIGTLQHPQVPCSTQGCPTAPKGAPCTHPSSCPAPKGQMRLVPLYLGTCKGTLLICALLAADGVQGVVAAQEALAI